MGFILQYKKKAMKHKVASERSLFITFFLTHNLTNVMAGLNEYIVITTTLNQEQLKTNGTK